MIVPSCASTMRCTIAKPRPGAGVLRREERVEDPIEHVRRNARAGVVHDQVKLPRVALRPAAVEIDRRSSRRRSIASAAFSSRFSSACPISSGSAVHRQRPRAVDVAASRCASAVAATPARSPARRPRARSIATTLTAISRVNCSTWLTSASSRFTPPEILLHQLSATSGRSRDVLRQHRRVKLNPAQRIADLVRHARGHFAQRGQAVLALEQPILLAQFLLQRSAPSA